jgi:hypothetical protein
MSTAWRWVIVCAVLLPALLSCIGCSKEASFEPLFELSPQERFRSDTLVATESEWFNLGASAGPGWSSTRSVVCNWTGYDSRAFLRFTAFPDTSAVIDSVLLYLWTTRVEGGAGGAVIDIHTLVDTLEQKSLYWGNMPGISEEPVASLEVPSAPGSLFVDVTQTVVSWIKGEGRNYGFALKARDETGPEFLVEFATREVTLKTIDDSTSLDFRPALRIAYLDTAGESQRAVSIATEDTFADTLVQTFPDDATHLVCGRGFPSRTFVRFSVDQIPEGSTVTRSMMTLTVDPAASSFDSIGIACHAILDYPWDGFGTTIGVTGTAVVTLEAQAIGSEPQVKFDVKALVQPLVARQENNFGFAVRASNEVFDLDFVRFWSHLQPDSDLRPKLVIDYLLPPAIPYPEVGQP